MTRSCRAPLATLLLLALAGPAAVAHPAGRPAGAAPRLVHVRTLPGPPLWRVDYDPRGRFFACTRGKGDYGDGPERVHPRSVLLCAPATGATLRTLTGMTSHVWDVAFSPGGDRLAACGHDGTLRTWAIPSGRPLTTSKLPEAALKCLAWSPDGREIATGDFAFGVARWDAATGRLLRRAALPVGERLHLGINQVAFTRNARRLVSLTDDDAIVTWTLPGLRKVREFGAYPTAAFVTDGRRLVHLRDDPWRRGATGSLAVWDLHTGRTRLLPPVVAPEAAWRGPGHVVGTTDDARLAIVRLADGRVMARGPRVPDPDGHVTGCAVSPDGRRIVAGSVYADGLWMYEVR